LTLVLLSFVDAKLMIISPADIPWQYSFCGNIGPDVPSAGLQGYIVPMEPSTCCGSTCSLRGGSTHRDAQSDGWIALIARGNCSFVQKVLNAQQAGASAVVVSNNRGHDQLVIMGGSSNHVNIPAVFVSEDSGKLLRQYLDDSSIEDKPRLEVRLSPCGMDSSLYGRGENMFLPDYLLLLAVFSTMLCSMCVVGVIRWRIQFLYPDAAPPVEEVFVINLPQRTCTEDEDKECCICLGSFEAGETVRILPCRHEYHAQCIDQWLTSHHRTCPICKGDITESSNSTEASSDEGVLMDQSRCCFRFGSNGHALVNHDSDDDSGEDLQGVTIEAEEEQHNLISESDNLTEIPLQPQNARNVELD